MHRLLSTLFILRRSVQLDNQLKLSQYPIVNCYSIPYAIQSDGISVNVVVAVVDEWRSCPVAVTDTKTTAAVNRIAATRAKAPGLGCCSYYNQYNTTIIYYDNNTLRLTH